MVLAYTFFKPYISNIYIYDLEFNWFQILRLLHPIIHLPQKSKIQMDTWWKSKLQLKSNLEFNWIWTLIFTFNNSFGTKLKIKWDTWRKIENLIKLKISISPKFLDHLLQTNFIISNLTILKLSVLYPPNFMLISNTLILLQIRNYQRYLAR